MQMHSCTPLFNEEYLEFSDQLFFIRSQTRHISLALIGCFCNKFPQQMFHGNFRNSQYLFFWKTDLDSCFWQFRNYLMKIEHITCQIILFLLYLFCDIPSYFLCQNFICLVCYVISHVINFVYLDCCTVIYLVKLLFW